MRTPATAILLLSASTHAWADKPTLAESKATLLKLGDANNDSNKARGKKAAEALLAAPFAYDVTFYDDKCKKKYTGGELKAVDGAFIDCLFESDWQAPLDAGSAKFSLVDMKKLPKLLAKHSTKLAALGKDHQLVLADFVPAGPAENWGIYALIKDKAGIRIAAIFAAGEVHDP